MLALLWRYGAPVVTLALTLLALVLWRGGVRFGPLAAAPEAARRSLVEQIRGTGQFILRHGGGISFHAASVRALDEAAGRRVPLYSLSPVERAAALPVLASTKRSRGGRSTRSPIHLPQHDRAARSGETSNPHRAHEALAWNTLKRTRSRRLPSCSTTCARQSATRWSVSRR
jgi:hypothetical protein